MAKPTDITLPNRYSAESVALDRQLTDRVLRAHAAMTTAMAELLAATAEASESEAHWAQGSQSASEWLVANLKIHGKTARDWTRLAHRLEEFPMMRAKMAEGLLGYDQVCQLLKFLEPDAESTVVEEAIHECAEDLEVHARAARRVTPDRVKKTRSERWYEGFFDLDEMKYSFRGEIPGQDGLIVDRAMRLLAWNAAEAPVYEVPRDREHRLADALVEMASSALAEHSNHDVATIVVHVDAAALDLNESVGSAEFSTDVPIETIRRLTCDGRLQLVAHAENGEAVGVGRKTRTIPGWLRRLIRERDLGCRFPGCRRTYWTQVHHMTHWAHGGRTDFDNLILLCGHHHRMLHEDGWSVAGDPSGRVDWTLPSGSIYQRPPGRRAWEDWRDQEVIYLKSGVWPVGQLVRTRPG